MVGIIPDGPEFDDTLDIHLGAEYKLDDRTKIMAGFQRKESPVPDQSGKITNYIDMDQNIYSVGGSYRFNNPIELIGSFRYFTFEDLSVDKTGVKGVTWGESIDPNVTQNSYKVSGSSYMLSVALKVNL
jgi:long-subunit fatty acid transport protein